MAVTDMTESLPWWARQGVGGYGSPGGPGGAPQASGGPPGASSTDWLRYLLQMASPSSANAAEAPSPIAVLNAGGTPPVNNDIVPPVGPPPAPAQPQPDPAATHMPFPQDPGPAATHMPYPGQIDPRGYFAPSVANPNAPAPAAQPVSASAPAPRAAGPVAGPLASSRFIGIDRPNADPLAGGRGGGGGPQGTALDLSGLFHGKPTVSVTRGLGAMANGGAPSGDNWDIDANGNVMPRYGPAGGAPGRQSGFVAPGRQSMSPGQLAGVVGKPGWWQSLGRPDMTPDQLAAAVRKRNWFQNT